MKTIEDLTHEHNAVIVALSLLEKIASAIDTGNTGAQKHLADLLEFFEGFVDKCHHSKEEDVLFPELERLGVARQGGPIGVMLSEHDAGRGHVRAIADNLKRLQAGDRAAATQITQHANAYSEMLRAHIDKENNVLFVMAARLIPADVDERLAGQFDVIERERVGEGKHEAYHALLHQLKDQYGV